MEKGQGRASVTLGDSGVASMLLRVISASSAKYKLDFSNDLLFSRARVFGHGVGLGGRQFHLCVEGL